MKKFAKQCPSCYELQTYGSEKVYLRALKGNWKCRVCSTKANDKIRDKLFFKTDKYRLKMSGVLKEKRKTESYGEVFKQKCRENKLKQINKCGSQRTFNFNACEFMDKLNKRIGINLRHGLNGGEYQVIGYSLDGYDKEKNIIFEYDEPKHHILSVKNRDIERQNRLISHLNLTKFLRYDEKKNILYDVVNKEVLCLHQ